MSNDFVVSDVLETGMLLERFLADCQALSDEYEGDVYSFTYVADTIAAIYYHREYGTAKDFLDENADYIDEERSEWVKYMWRTLDTMTEEQKANVVIESLTQLPVTAEQ
jgi:hypothetical protein